MVKMARSPSAMQGSFMSKNIKKGRFWLFFDFFCKKVKFFFFKFCERHVNTAHFWTYSKVLFNDFFKYIANIKISSMASNENQLFIGIYVFLEKFEKKI